MIDTQNNIRLQSCLYVLFLLSVLSGVLSLIGHTWPQLPVPVSYTHLTLPTNREV